MAEINRTIWDRAANAYRRLVDSATIAWSTSTPGQASASLVTIVDELASLPTAAVAGAGYRAFVTDADTPVFGDVAVGGGSAFVPVYSDGTDWRVG